jgi:hypothetical protein
MSFELYQHSPGRQAPTEPSATIQKGGYLTLSEGAYQALGRPTGVELLYAPDIRAVGVRAANNSPHAFELKQHPTGRSYRVQSTRAFMNHYGIPTDSAHRYPARLDPEQGLLIIELEQGQPVIRGGIIADP